MVDVYPGLGCISMTSIHGGNVAWKAVSLRYDTFAPRYAIRSFNVRNLA